MYKHLLIAVDGSLLAESAFKRGLTLAKEMGATVTVLRVVPEDHLLAYQAEMLEDVHAKLASQARIHAVAYLDGLELQARHALVPCETATAIDDHPYAAIVRTACELHCDLIVMASHGRRGMQGFLLGSETQKVLTHSKLPVLVFKAEHTHT